MKKNLFITFSIMLFALLLFPGCHKEAAPASEKTLSDETESEFRRSHHGNKDGCRLISNTSEFGEDTYTYNHRGLLDEWHTSGYDGYFKMEYNTSGRLVKSRLYSGGILVNTIIFFYHKDEVVKETWYNGDTQEKTDEVFYSYNKNGLIWKSESDMGDYYTIYKHSPEGNVLEWKFYLGGSPFYAGTETYYHHHKNPYLAITGLHYGFPYINAGMFQNKWDVTSEKVVYYDEEGNPQVIYDEDPHKTIVQFNRDNYVTEADFFDVLTLEYFHFRYDYENCDCENHDGKNSANPFTDSFSPSLTKKQGPFLTIRQLKERIIQLRKQSIK